MRRINEKHLEKGFTLIESAIVMLILAVIIGAAIVPYKLWRLNQITLQTNLNMDSVTAAFTNFITQNGRYPCPARTDVGRTHADYGMEGICDNTDLGYPAVVTAGTCSGGFCYEQGRAVFTDPTLPAGTETPQTIRRGSVPFRVLGLTEGQSEDGYGMRIQYAISENLTVPETYVDISGGISIVDGTHSLIDPPGSAHYVIFSSGHDKNGGISREGMTVNPCVAGRKDTENCNTAMGATDNELAVYSLAPYSTTGGADHNDDNLKFYSSFVTPLWRKSSDSGLHIRDLIDVASGGKIGINTSVPVADVDVAGTVKVDSGSSLVDGLCPQNAASNCFSVADFGDPAPVAPTSPFICPAGSVATGFGAGKMTCTTDQTVRCPAGERLTGIEDDGELICGNFRGCPSHNVTICGEVTNLPASNRWRNSYPTGGPNDRQERWRCRNRSPN
ncbi:MAG: prepilin-type N-terminal cleavage/methylation domain-containing protein, partial [Gammaproteobacteria bacterium]|nr:prepilin-type N-terminal cleavage/methylation domain-containing protein [Gammaproteobacteria bacterium]